jgi:lipopolysaccharide transport system ATP-binding protein
MKPIISVDHLGKRYRIGRREAAYATLRDSLATAVTSPISRVRRVLKPKGNGTAYPERHIWALKDVGFDVRPGEVVGIIGRNGAGKSTLLKVLSRITEPTEGSVSLWGRVSSLLEVGTGFHGELTGRENVYLSGSILGMRRSEIDRKFDDIVEFSEVETFIDTPVKHYSSGMQMRLAFAVAAHLEPEILVIDEVLAVGDTGFHRKCLKKMEDVSHQGRTVLIVSHSMPTVTRLCARAILLEAGRVVLDGPAHRVVDAYLTSGCGPATRREWPDPHRAPGDDVARLRAVWVRTEARETIETADIRRPVGIAMAYDVLRPGHVLTPNLHLYNEEGICVFVTGDHDPAWSGRPRPIGRHVSTAWIPGNFLAEGKLTVGAALSTMDPVIVHFYERDAVAFMVIDTNEGDSVRGDYAGPFPGVVRPWLRWTNECSEDDPTERARQAGRVLS